MTRLRSASAHLRTFRLKEGYRIAGQEFTSADNVILELHASDGRTSYGCAAPFERVTGESPAASLAALNARLIPLLQESDLDDLGGLAARAAVVAPESPAARAAVEIALHDRLARQAGVPLYRLLGARRERIPTSFTLGISADLEATVATARRRVAEGFRILKLKVGEDWEHDVRLVRALRAALGSGVHLRADANEGYQEADARRFLIAADELGLELLEQPLAVENDAGVPRLARLTRVPLMADESLSRETDVARLAGEGGFAHLNIKLMKTGGLLEALAIARTASGCGLGVMFGCNDESRISIAAALHTALAAPGDVRADLDGHLDLVDDVASGGVRIHDGCIEPVEAPGLGISVHL